MFIINFIIIIIIIKARNESGAIITKTLQLAGTLYKIQRKSV